MTTWIYGDVTLDNHEYEHPGNYADAYCEGLALDGHPYPKLSGRIRNRFVARKFGGAHLLARHVAVAMAVWSKEHDVNTTAKELNELHPWAAYRKDLGDLQEALVKWPTQFENVLNLFYRISKDPDNAYRMQPGGYEGYTLPLRKHIGDQLFFCLLGAGKGAAKPMRHLSEPIRIQDTYEQSTLCLFNDGGTRLRYEDPAWLLSEPWAQPPYIGKTWAIVKSHEPALDPAMAPEAKSAFFGALYDLLPGRSILIINADDLRRDGVAISRSLSWEQSMRDSIDRIKDMATSNPSYIVPEHVVVRFDYDAALYLRTSRVLEAISVEKAVLVFSTSRSEGEFQSKFVGSMPGAQTMFTSVFAGLIHAYFAEHPADYEEKPDEIMHGRDILIEKILTYALIAKQQMLRCGFEIPTDRNIFICLDGEIDRRRALWLAPKLMYHESVFALPAVREADGMVKREHDGGLPTALRPSASKPDRFCHPLDRDKEISAVEQLRKDQETYELSGISLGENWLSERESEIFDVFSEALPMQGFVEYVKTGKVKNGNLVVHMPIAKIGKIKTISSLEIESLRQIRRLTQSYLAESNTSPTPLGIAVFGQPGSGKSFTVKSVFATLQGRSKELIEGSFIECNLSGLSDPEEIAHIFQKARDFRLLGKVPVIFFDEFDCSVGGIDFFWLKHFLAPLQDGVFTSGQMTHPIGKSIFVFAGGVTQSYGMFAAQVLGTNGRSAKRRKWTASDSSRFDGEAGKLAKTKGRDFLSRLQGHIDIEGLWPMDRDGNPQVPGEEFLSTVDFRRCVMRRAILLREILYQRARGIFGTVDGADIANIDDRIVEAFLREDTYNHGVRSIEAVIRMSSLDSVSRFTPECLPTRRQLEMHVSQPFHGRAFGLRAAE